MMKKLTFFLFLVVLLGSLLLSGCLSNDADDVPEEKEDQETVVVEEKDVETETEEDTTDETETEVEENTTEEEVESESTVVLENEAFRIFEPAPDSEVSNEFTVRGEARVFEAVVSYDFEDGHFILAEGTVMASEGAPNWGEFEITIQFDELSNDAGRVFLYEESAKDGSRQHELAIPVKHKQD